MILDYEDLAAFLVEAEKRGCHRSPNGYAQDLLAMAPGNRKDQLIAALVEQGFWAVLKKDRVQQIRANKLAQSNPVQASKELAEAQARRVQITAATAQAARKSAETVHRVIKTVVNREVKKEVDTIFSTWLVDGRTPLGVATYAQLQTASNNSRNSANGHLRYCEFYEGLLKRMDPTQTVPDVFTADEADALRRAAFTPEPVGGLASKMIDTGERHV